MVKNWHKAIIAESQKQLGRDLTPVEETFITSHGGFFALEMIEDTVKSLKGTDLEIFLRSEQPEN